MIDGCCLEGRDPSVWIQKHAPLRLCTAGTTSQPKPADPSLLDNSSSTPKDSAVPDSTDAWISRMKFIATSPDAIGEDGELKSLGKKEVWPQVAMDAFAAAATSPASAVSAVSSVMRAMWLCLYSFDTPTRQKKCIHMLQVCLCFKYDVGESIEQAETQHLRSLSNPELLVAENGLTRRYVLMSAFFHMLQWSMDAGFTMSPVFP